MKNFSDKKEKGFIALISAIIISAILVTLSFTLSINSFSTRINSLNREFKRVSLGLSESCVNTALLKISQNYNYSPGALGETINIGSNTCKIKSVTYSLEDPITHLKIASIKTQASYSGSFTDIETKVSVRNPTVPPLAPLPTCSIIASPPQIPSGHSTALQWGVSPNAVSFTLDHGLGSVGLGGGPLNVTPAGSGSVTYIGTVLNSTGGFTQCSVTITITPPPPTPACADTVVMLDRTGSMSSGDRANERNATRDLMNLYNALTTIPKMGIGRFGDNTNGGLEAEIIPNSIGTIIGQLTNLYGDDDGVNDNDLYNAKDLSTSANSSVGTNLSDAITVGNTELNSIRHTAGNKKFLIIVSDGDPNEPTPSPTEAALTSSDNAKLSGTEIFTIHFGSVGTGNINQNYLAQLATGNVTLPPNDTGYFSPTSNSHSGTDNGSSFNNPTSAYGNGGGNATSINNSGSKQRYYNFNLPSIPAGSTINDIQIKTDAWVTDQLVASSTKPTSVSSNYDQWSVNTGNKSAAVQTNDGATTYITTTTNGQAQTFQVMNTGIPNNAVVTSVVLTAYAAKNGSNNSNIILRVEKGTGSANRSDDGGNTVNNTTYTAISRTMNTNPFTGSAWTVSEVNNWTTRFGVVRNSSSGTPRVTQIAVTVNYIIPSTGCQLGVELSWDGGLNWSTEQTWTLPNTETTNTFTTITNWGTHIWNSNDFINTNFRVRVHSIDTGSTCENSANMNLDWVQAKVMYGSNHEPGSSNDKATVALENSDGDNFFIAPASSDMPAIFTTIGSRCPALAPQCSNTIDDDGDSLIDTLDPACHTDNDASNSLSFDPTDNDEWSTPPLPPPPVYPPPPPNITIGSWEEATTTP